MKEKQKEFQDVVLPTENGHGEHSLICNEDLFYAELRAAAEDSEKESFPEEH
jgi:hypothetical protein